MLNQKEFINEVWNKYEKYSNNKKNKEKFFSNHVYKNSENILKIKTFIMPLIGIFAATGIVYAGIATYNLIQKETNTDFQKNSEYDYNQNMIYDNSGLYYKKVTTYNEYIECLKIWNNLVEMNQTDFEENFIIIFSGENQSTIGLTISNIETDNNTISIELIKKQNEEENTVISTKIPIEQNRENISIKIKHEQLDSTEYIDIKKLPINYTKQQAAQDGCIVIEKNNLISNNNEKLKNFILKTQNNINESIRFVTYFDNQITIYDVKYKNGKYNIWIDDTRNGGEISYKEGNKIYDIPFGSLERRIYIEDKIGNQIIICNTK